MGKAAKGKMSSVVAEDRRLNILLRLMAGGATSEELRQIILDKDFETGYERTVSGLQKCLENDLMHLRGQFHAEISFRDGYYELTAIDRPLLDLTDNALRGLAFLQQTFSTPAAVMGTEVRTFLDTVVMVLPRKRLRQIERERHGLELNVNPRDKDDISEDVRDTVLRACNEKRQLEFEYYSPSRVDQSAVTHLVEPLSLYFDSKHYYLEAYCIETRSVNGVIAQDKIFSPYRLGRIRSPRILPTHFRPERRRAAGYELVYILAPEVVRGGISEYTRISSVENQPDGSAVVHTRSTNLFMDLRNLLHYGANCRVIGGNQAVREMQTIIKAIYGEYFELG